MARSFCLLSSGDWVEVAERGALHGSELYCSCGQRVMVGDVMRIQRTAFDASRFPPFPPALDHRLYEVLELQCGNRGLGCQMVRQCTCCVFFDSLPFPKGTMPWSSIGASCEVLISAPTSESTHPSVSFFQPSHPDTGCARSV